MNERRRSSWIGQIGLRVLGRHGAKAGLAWVGVMLVCAVFAPFLASSHPLALKTREGWSSPVLEYLTPVDAMLVAGFLLALALACLRRIPAGTRAVAWIWLMAAAAPACFWRSWSATAAKAQVHFGTAGWADDEKSAVGFWIGSALAALVVAAFLVGLPFASRAGAKTKGGVLAAALCVCALLAAGARNPPAPHYASDRQALQADSALFVLNAPVPFSPDDIQSEKAGMAKQAPTPEHPFGTDPIGADVLSQMIHACRIALSIGLIATAIEFVLGVLIGGAMGYRGGIVDMLGMRLVEIFSSIPVILLLIMICAFYKRDLYLMMVIIGLTGWVEYAIFIRAEFLRLRMADFVQAARAVGAGDGRILWRHMLPNGVAPALTLASFGIASAILTESTLSFLGLGLPPGEASWGRLLNSSRDGAEWWLVVFPGGAIFLTVFAYNLVGEALQVALDPKRSK